METDEPTTNVRLRGAKSANAPLLPEVDCYLHLLVLLFLMDAGKKFERMPCSEKVLPRLWQLEGLYLLMSYELLNEVTLFSSSAMPSELLKVKVPK